MLKQRSQESAGSLARSATRREPDQLPRHWLVATGLVWVIMILFVYPAGEFPLNDDWVYVKAVKSLVETGHLMIPPGWASMTMVAHILWGALVCLTFGFSFLALRISTALLGLVGIFACYALFADSGLQRRHALFGALVIAVNPLYMQLSNSFMTDVPFFAVFMLSLVYVLRGLRSERKADVWIGVGLSLIATMIRQIGILSPLAFAAGYLYKHGLRWRSFCTSAVPILLTVALLVAYHTILSPLFGFPSLINQQAGAISQLAAEGVIPFAQRVVFRMIVIFIYLGVFLLPFLLLTRRKNMVRRGHSLWRVALLGFWFVLSAVGLLSKSKWMPLCGGVMYNCGVGPPTLIDAAVLDIPNLPMPPPIVWPLVTILGILGAAAIIMRLASRLAGTVQRVRDGKSEDDWALVVPVVAICSLYYILIAPSYFFDRYILLFLPLVIVLIGKCSPNERYVTSRSTVLLSVVAAAGIGLFAVVGTHDYFAWNRARWEALHWLTDEQKIPPTSIDGGFEFNGWYTYDPTYKQEKGKSWWWVVRDDYLIAFGPVPGFKEIRRFGYRAWFHGGDRDICVLRKVESS